MMGQNPISADEGKQRIPTAPYNPDMVKLSLALMAAQRREVEANNANAALLIKNAELKADLKFALQELSDSLIDKFEQAISAKINEAALKKQGAELGIAATKEWHKSIKEAARADAAELASRTDPMTGIPNRKAFTDHLQSLAGRPDNQRHAIMSLDLAGLKALNDTLHPSAGDAAIATIAHTLHNRTNDNIFAARMGGDEFAVVISAESYDEMKSLHDIIDDALAHMSIRHGGEIYDLQCHSAVSPISDILNPHRAWDKACEKMNEAKKGRKNQRDDAVFAIPRAEMGVREQRKEIAAQLAPDDGPT